MKYKILVALFGIAILGIKSLNAQTIFTTKQEVAEYMEGEWNMDVARGGFAGATYYIPNTNYFDSTIHKIVFEITAIDSTPLKCKSYIDGALYQETFVSISENPFQVVLPRWLLINLPDNLSQTTGLMEEWGFYGFSQDTTVLLGYGVTDGFEFGLSRLMTSTAETHHSVDVKIYPNPSSGNLFIEGIKSNAQYELFDITGRLLRTEKLNGNSLIIENKGIYFLRLKIQNKWIARKIIIH